MLVVNCSKMRLGPGSARTHTHTHIHTHRGDKLRELLDSLAGFLGEAGERGKRVREGPKL